MLQKIQSKIHSWDSICKQIEVWRSGDEKLVFTNGCFDLLHYGHVHYLAQAKDLGDRLIVGLNSRDSVRRLKGAGRPINDLATRQNLLAAMECVDAVVVFEQDTPLELIGLIQPDILVKGGDYKTEDIVGAELVLQRGGRVESLAFVEGYSSSLLEAKIKKG